MKIAIVEPRSARALSIAMLALGALACQRNDSVTISCPEALTDACGICDQDPKNDCRQDCAGVYGGAAFADECLNCVGGTTSREPCRADCTGELGGGAFVDECGSCVSGSTGLDACGPDCTGALSGSATLDECGTCVGGTTGLTACVADCAGVFGGTAHLDECATCVDGTTGATACTQDCAGSYGGTAHVDDCGTCVGGTTGLPACAQDCASVFGGTAITDGCGRCVAGTTGLTACTIVLAPGTVSVAEAASAIFDVTLSHAPAALVTVSLLSNAPAVASIDSASLTFDGATWNVAHHVTVSSPDDADVADETTTITLTSPGFSTVTENVSVADDDVTFTDLGVQMGPVSGGATNFIGTGFTSATSGTLNGAALLAPTVNSSTSLSGIAPAWSGPASHFATAVVSKGLVTAQIPRAYYYGSWARAAGLSGGTVRYVEHGSGNVVYAATDFGVYRSSDNAATWVEASTGLPAGGIDMLAIDPTDSTHLYAATSAGIYVSSTSGASWAIAGDLVASTTCIVIAPTLASLLYACGLNDLHVSSDGGAHWTVSKANVTTPRHVVFSRQDATHAYLASGQSIFKMSAGVWSAVTTGLTSTQGFALAVHATDDQTVYAAMSDGVFKTSNGGTGWSPTGTLSGDVPTAIAVDPVTPNTVYVATTAGAYLSIDGGAIWTAKNTGLHAAARALHWISVRSATPSEVYVAANDWGVFQSTDSAANWTRADSGLTAFVTQWIAPHPATDGAALATLRGQGVWHTSDFGATWTSLNGDLVGTNIDALTVAFAPSAPATVFAGFNGAGVWKSVNGGTNWAATAALSGAINGVAVDPTNPSIVYAATSNGIWKSTTGGAAWTAINNGLVGLNVVAIAFTGTVLLASEANNGVFRSINSGNLWVPSPTVFATAPRRFHVDATGTDYAQTSTTTFRSDTNGQTWVAVANDTFAFAADPSRAATLYVGSNTGAKRTLTSFATTVDFTLGLPAATSGALAVDRSADALYFGVAGHGLWRVAK